MERKGVVGASERNPWHKADEPLADNVDVFVCYSNGAMLRSCKIGGMWLDTDENPVLYWMHIPPLPGEYHE